MRGIAPALALIIVIVGLVGLGYYVGMRKGAELAARWMPIVEDVLRWRRLELQGSEAAAAELLQGIRGRADMEELHRDRNYLEIEEE